MGLEAEREERHMKFRQVTLTQECGQKKGGVVSRAREGARTHKSAHGNTLT